MEGSKEGSEGGKGQGDKDRDGKRTQGRKNETERVKKKKKKRAWFLLKSFLHIPKASESERAEEQKGTHLRRLEYLRKLHVRLDFYGDF